MIKCLKIVIIVTVLLFSLLLIGISLNQYYVEQYIETKREEFNIFEIKRKRFLPFLVYVPLCSFNSKEKYYREVAQTILFDFQLKHNKQLIYRGHIDSYIIFCYYSDSQCKHILKGK